MEPQIAQQFDQTLRQNWQSLSEQLLQTFTQVSRSDVDSATSADDLVRRISDKTHYTERFVETKIGELVGVGAGATAQTSQSPQQSRYGSISQQSQSQSGSGSSSSR